MYMRSWGESHEDTELMYKALKQNKTTKTGHRCIYPCNPSTEETGELNSQPRLSGDFLGTESLCLKTKGDEHIRNITSTCLLAYKHALMRSTHAYTQAQAHASNSNFRILYNMAQVLTFSGYSWQLLL